MKENSLTLKKARSKWKLVDVECADDLALLVNTVDQDESLMHKWEQAGRCIDLYMDSNKTELIYFNKDDTISINGMPLELVDQFI